MRQKLFSVGIADCRVDTFCSGGKGGQHQNATRSGVRITHPPSGAVGVSREERYQKVNKRRAFERMAKSPVFTAWVRMTAAYLRKGKTVEQLVEEEMDPRNLRIEVQDERGRWTDRPPCAGSI